MVDWAGLFKFSMSYSDDTNPSQFKPMSEEERKWLEGALKQYTFNDAERLGEICEELKNPLSKEKTLDLLDELLELVEVHVRNNLNLCICGGMQTLLGFVLNRSDKEVV